jgi:Ca2+/Na+ antiporter
MNTNYSNGEVYGSRFFNWAVIVGAAALVIVSFNSLAPQQSVQTAAAAAKTVAVSADKHPAG